MISKPQIKLIRSLANKKYRRKYGKFIAEGTKLAQEILHAPLSVDKVYATATWLEAHRAWIAGHKNTLFEEVTEHEMKQISMLSTPSDVLLLVNMPENTHYATDNHQFILALDAIRDPGNLGTIIRMADWYGLNRVYCSPDCTDAYNPKTVQATMGSIVRVAPVYIPLPELIKKAGLPVYAAVLDGHINIHHLQTPEPAVLLIGNESQGISDELRSLATDTLRIPQYGGAESLNAAIATGILLDNFCRSWGDKWLK